MREHQRRALPQPGAAIYRTLTRRMPRSPSQGGSFLLSEAFSLCAAGKPCAFALSSSSRLYAFHTALDVRGDPPPPPPPPLAPPVHHPPSPIAAFPPQLENGGPTAPNLLLAGLAAQPCSSTSDGSPALSSILLLHLQQGEEKKGRRKCCGKRLHRAAAG